MSVDNVKNFYAKVNEDESLQQQLIELARTSAEESMQALIQLANEQGFSFDNNDLEAFFAETAKNLSPTGELSEAELDAVAGGDGETWALASIINVYICVVSLIQKAISSCGLDEADLKRAFG
jgi:predicted ribosomally synthesized peptide with nif11-like leader